MTVEYLTYYIALISQIFIISYYFPNKIYDRMRTVVTQYPPAQYPKLYPLQASYYDKFHSNYRKVNQLISIVGIGLLLYLTTTSFELSYNHLELIALAYFFLQMAPVLRLELSEYNQLKHMRELNTANVRQAELHRRSLFDYISQAHFFTAVLLYLVAVIFMFYLGDFAFDLGKDGYDAALQVLILTLGNMFFGFIIYKNIYGKKQNPHQDNKDRGTQIVVAVHSLVGISMVMSVFFAFIAAGDKYDLNPFEPLFTSLYLQIIAMISFSSILNLNKIEDMNFDVYKKNSSSS